ncbi:glycosyltransferase family 4 protein [Capnocytophaga canimorsus]|uniref:glycosyltransferase family 4 protein n=1 Tax=Capnocytophaga canimorsus TaxID=28188 RepID=UPI001ACCBD06|nr:glycosyltransferase family 4 protein [Capnocytophaga canimorsus]GIM59544.1 glycosyltransferase WbuB [Capnocytophaga canimorsus]
MNVLFLTLIEINSIEERGIYQDLLRKFRDEGHRITIVTPIERRKNISTHLQQEKNVSILQVKTLNIQKTNIIEKGLGTLLIDYQYQKAIKKYLAKETYDLVLYTTPPITFTRAIEYIKKRDKAITYLLLKDIFPQNAVDIEMMKKGNFFYKIFRKKEKKLYQISDYIGCMSPANQAYVLKHNPEIQEYKVEVNPNTITPISFEYSDAEKENIRNKYGIPLDKKIFVYGGNLGKPQGIDFLLETISATKRENVFFLIVGNGTEYGKIKTWFQQHQPTHAKLIQKLPKDDFDKLLTSCDVGLIFLDKRFTIPNFPSRLLSYLEMKMPVLVASDSNTDIGTIVEQQAKCGYKVLAGNQKEMQEKINLILKQDMLQLGENGYQFLLSEYTVDVSYDLILSKFKNKV